MIMKASRSSQERPTPAWTDRRASIASLGEEVFTATVRVYRSPKARRSVVCCGTEFLSPLQVLLLEHTRFRGSYKSNRQLTLKKFLISKTHINRFYHTFGVDSSDSSTQLETAADPPRSYADPPHSAGEHRRLCRGGRRLHSGHRSPPCRDTFGALWGFPAGRMARVRRNTHTHPCPRNSSAFVSIPKARSQGLRSPGPCRNLDRGDRWISRRLDWAWAF
jgi:hypothetical protein